MMSKDDWTDKMREQLVDYEMPTVEDLWPAIEQALAHGKSSASKQVADTHVRIVRLKRWSIVAAACVVLGIGVTLEYIPSYDEVVKTSGQRIIVKKVKDNQYPRQSLTMEDEIGHMDKKSDGMALSAPPLLCRSRSQSSTLLPLSLDGCEVMAEDHVDVSADTSRTCRQSVSKKQMIAQTAQTVGNQLFSPNACMVKELGSGGSRQNEKWSMTLYAENGFVGGNGTLGSGAPLMSSSDALLNGSTMVTLASFVTAKERQRALMAAENVVEKHHHQPLSIGAQFGIRLGSRLSLSAGVAYTRVVSDFGTEAYGMQSDISQILHYVGVPVGLDYEVLAVYGFHTYVSVGAEADVNVKNETKLDGERQEVKRDCMQWSTNASLGIQYDVVPQLGVYVEPGLRYYIDNGSGIDNIFKDKKLNFGIQFGLRWKIK